jgi:hypothetical protein
MKYMIMMYGSQQEYDAMAGKDTGKPAWRAEDVAAMTTFMDKWNNELVESGEFVDAQGLAAPVHTRRIGQKNGAQYVTDGPYPETAEVLAGYTIVECESFDRATEIAARIADCPIPPEFVEGAYVEVRPVAGGPPDYNEV